LKKLYVIDGPDKGKSFDLNDGITTIGRSSDNDICISDIGVSRHHAKFFNKANGIFIVDLKSSQGVFIDGERIETGPEVEIKKDSNLIIGNTTLSFQKEPTGRKPYPILDTSESLLAKDNTRNYIRSLELVLKVSNIFAQSLNIDELLDKVIDQIFNHLKRIDRGAILLLNKETGKFRMVASKTRMEDKEGILSKINYSRTIVNRTIKEGRPVMMSDTSRVDKAHLSDSIEQMNIMSVMCVPLKYKLLTGLSNTAAIAIENARLFEAVKKELFERKRAEEEKKKLEVQFRYAQKMEALGTLAGGIAHNFNNFLMGIQGNVSLMLLETDPNHPNYKRLKNIEKLIDSGSKLTSQLLGYTREGRYEVKPFSLNQVVKEASDTFDATKKEIRVHQELSEDLFGINADQGQIKQVLLDLYVNAADAMPRGGDLFLKTINVTHKDITGKPYRVKPGRYVLLTIVDTGVGMDKTTMDRIFDPFFTTKGLSKATGLGLASVYGIVKAHAGYIDVDSKKGHGTTFSIYLPSYEKEVVEEKDLSPKVLKGKETVLLVDDDDMIVDVSSEMLSKMGYDVLIARGGKEAIEIISKAHNLPSAPDLVILDMIMPEMGGGETFDRMKEIDPEIKVLLSSGYSIDGQAKEILNRGCSGFIQKPFSMKELSVRIREILDKE
jgi:signal transduction histidine kinase/CheY-like chemotaxis protein